MNNAPNGTEKESASISLGLMLRDARRARNWTIGELAEKLGRPREWLNRIELGYSVYGEHKPPSISDLKTLCNYLDSPNTEAILALGHDAQSDFNHFKQQTGRRSRFTKGKLTQAEVIIGEDQITEAIVDLIREQHSDAVIRNTGIKGLASYVQASNGWTAYREALGEFLANNPNGLFKRIEYAPTKQQLGLAKMADLSLAGGRKLEEVHNAKVKFDASNPLQMHVLIGQREAIIALPQCSGQGGSNMALLVRDKIFVEALRVWYDEVLWDNPGDTRQVDFAKFDESFAEISKWYEF